ncbi:MAG: SDR family oxidoreductase [Pirellulales bacterium]
MSKLIVGCGYLGSRVARRWRNAGHEVFVVTRDAEHARRFAEERYQPIVADVLRPASLAHLPAADTVLYAVGYDRGSGVSIHEVYASGLRSVLDALPGEPARIIYTSSTGVYGQSQGETVDEESTTAPTREGGRACLAAERALAAHRLGHRGVVLRMAGLYGPGRIPLAGEIRRVRPIAAPQNGSLNLIHVDDAASAVLAADERAVPPRTYVVSDGHPVERRRYYEELARLLGAPSPCFATSPVDSPASARAASDKRVDNARMLGELRVRLAHPSYREGLAAIVAAQSTAPGDG